MKKILFILLTLCLISVGNIFAQDGDDLLNMLDVEVGEAKIKTIATFKSTRIVNGQSIERMQANQLDFRINHRFGKLNEGFYTFWGLDQAFINFCFEYGVTNWLQLGVRRGTEQKTYDGSAKFSILRQTQSGGFMPISLSFFSDAAINTLKITDGSEDKLIHRLGYTHQLLIARKFSESISLQLSPSYVHRNRVDYFEENDIYAIGIGGKYKFMRRVSLMAEYFYATHTASSLKTDNKFYNPIAIGFDIETGGHVFQIFVTNSVSMVEKGFLAETTGDITKGDLYFGFNISRVFAPHIGKKKSE